MTKNELIAAVADKAQMTKTAAASAVDATFDAITAALKKGGEVKVLLYTQDVGGSIPSPPTSIINNLVEISLCPLIVGVTSGVTIDRARGRV